MIKYEIKTNALSLFIDEEKVYSNSPLFTQDKSPVYFKDIVSVEANIVTPSLPSEYETKSHVDGDDHTLDSGVIYWDETDQCSFFYYGDSNVPGGDRFSIYKINSEDKTKASFTGSLNNFIFGSIPAGETPYLWGVFPYMSTTRCDNTSVTVKFPNVQSIPDNSFDEKAHVLVGMSETFRIQLSPAYATIRFKLDTTVNPDIPDDITYIQFSAKNKDAILNGNVNISYDENGQMVFEKISGTNSLQLTPQDGSYFKLDTWYYFHLLPSQLTGFNMRFITESGEMGMMSYDKSLDMYVNRIVNAAKTISSNIVF